MAAAVSHGFTGVGRWLRKELVEAWPVFLFFLVGFLLLITLIKLALAQFSVEITVLSNAVVGALLAAKAALVLDGTPLARSLEHYRRIVAVAVKTFLYGVASLLLLSVERLLEALHKVHNLGAAVSYALEHASRYRIMAWALGISIVFALYFTFLEISKGMGEGALRRLFFESPKTANDSGRQTAIGVGKSRI
jgi:hypothetical protein